MLLFFLFFFLCLTVFALSTQKKNTCKFKKVHAHTKLGNFVGGVVGAVVAVISMLCCFYCILIVRMQKQTKPKKKWKDGKHFMFILNDANNTQNVLQLRRRGHNDQHHYLLGSIL